LFINQTIISLAIKGLMANTLNDGLSALDYLKVGS